MRKIMLALIAAIVLAGCGQVEEEPVVTREPGATAAREELLVPESLPESREQEREQETVGEILTPDTWDPELLARDDDVENIRLLVSENEIVLDRDDPEVIFYAEVPPELSPQTVWLIDADKNEPAAQLYDEADYEKYGDTIKGDGVYNCRLRLDTDFGTVPEVSEDVTYRYYARFTDGGQGYRSPVVEIFVMEQFTDEELEHMEAVSSAVSGLMESDGFKELDTDGKRAAVVELLEGFEEQGFVDRGSIYAGDETVTYSVAGAGHGVMLKGFDPRFN